MIGNWQVANEPVWKRHIAFSAAYLEGARTLCKVMLENKHPDWGEANVVLHLAVHSMELFLRGAILHKDQDAKFNANHRLSELYERYEEHYPDPPFYLERSFVTEYLGCPSAEVEYLRLKELVPSIMFRYPAQRSGKDWPGVHAFEPTEFSNLLDTIRESQRTIVKHLE